ncbi:ArnT family glycosyltransferase [Chitinophaga sp. NPDC101104]|uniref:ArnT family glycosyltransferase n=1 Tax=Chitinophaga sp. NPDC101104 TaxID=3390561 RepID=UPI003D047DDA
MIRFFTKDQYKNTVLALWALLAIVQACFTELMDDEAYYWVYSRHLDWGYFDHPPMIALLIKAGYALFHNELGVRLGMVVLNVGTLILTDKLISEKNNTVFYLILAGMGAMQLGGILAVPDIPLIFFAALYFYLYRNFLTAQNWKNTLLLGLGMALMFYSKYHGVLLVFFTVISNPHLLKLPRFWAAVLVTTAIFFPHLYWQYTHDFPSVQYHLFERNAKAYHYSYTLDYLAGQLLLFGPLVGWLLLYYAFRVPVKDSFERAMKFSLIGVLAFFALSTIKGRVEANWTVMVFAPLLVLAHQGIVRQGYSVKVLKALWIPSLVLVAVVRVYMMWDFLPGVRIRPEIHHNREWTAVVKEQAAGRPVVFLNSYQQPSKYMFYQGEFAYSLNTIRSRRSQYNFWPMEEKLWGKEIWLASSDQNYFPETEGRKTAQGTFYGKPQADFYAYSLLQLIPARKEFHQSVDEKYRFAVKNHYGVQVPVIGNGPALRYLILDIAGGPPEVFETGMYLRDLMGKDSVDIHIPKTGMMKNRIKLGLDVVPGLDPTHNSPVFKIVDF